MKKIIVGTVATLTFLVMMASNSQAALLIGGTSAPSGNIVKLRVVNNQVVSVNPTVIPTNTVTVIPKIIPTTTPTNWVRISPVNQNQAGNVVTIKRPTPTTTPTPVVMPPVIQTDAALTADEQEMIDAVNRQRIAAGVAPLLVDMRLVAVGRKKAADMKANNYFSHTSPTYGSPWAMMQAEGIKYKYAGENIAGNKSVAGAMTGFMNSPGHRANILHPSFTHIGIGIEYGTMYTNTYVQEFTQE